MIFHFIKRDFGTHKFHWVILVVFTILALFVQMSCRSIFPLFLLLGYGYLLFGMVPLSNLTGSAWRSQHVMSRNYLLSLPVNRKRLFLLTQFRALVFFTPFVLWAFITPLFVSKPVTLENYFPVENPLPIYPFAVYPLMVIATVAWLFNSMITLALSYERVSTYLTQQQRTIEHLKIMGVFLTESALIAFSFLSTILYTVSPFLPLILISLVAVLRFILTRKRWLGSQ